MLYFIMLLCSIKVLCYCINLIPHSGIDIIHYFIYQLISFGLFILEHRYYWPVYCNFIEYALMLLCNIYLYGTDVIGQMLLDLSSHRCCGAEVYYIIFSFGDANRTLSQICSRLYLPTFLLRVGLLTLM